MDINDLRIFARVATLENLTAVASELGLAAGTVSKRLQGLENTLKARLLNRTTRSIHLTEEGRAFLQRVERILAEFDIAQDELSASADRPAGRLKISAPASVAKRIVAPALVGFVEAFPEIDIRVDISDRVANLHEDGYDAAIRLGALSDSSLKAKRLACDRTVLAASAAYVSRHGAPRRAADLADHACLVHGDQRNWTFTRGEDKSSVRVAGRLASDSGAFLRMAALEGIGILRASHITVADDLAAGRLVQLLPDYDLASDAAIWIVYPNAKHAMPRLRALVDHLSAFCRDELSADSIGRAGPANHGSRIIRSSVEANEAEASRLLGLQRRN